MHENHADLHHPAVRERDGEEEGERAGLRHACE
jgi:hypothetical protein